MRTITGEAGAVPTVRDMRDTDLLLPAGPGDPVRLRRASTRDGNDPVGARAPLAVFVGGAQDHDMGQVPVAGRYERDDAWLTFTPAFAFVAGQDYVVRRGDGHHRRLTEFRIPASPEPVPARVTAVHPSGDALPENVLRFHLHVSVPMAPHRAHEFITLRDEFGRVDPAAFMRFKQELWAADRRRLTILIDPGRIKRGVATNLDRGPALLEGGRYALTVDEGWPTADGSSVLPAFSKAFRVVAPLRSRPAVSRWTWSSPRPGTRDPLVVAFDRPFDRHGLRDAIRVVTHGGAAVDGESRIGPAESSWSFLPDQSWGRTPVRLVVDDALEDVAGNTVHELLDRDLRGFSPADLTTFHREMAHLTGIQYGGVGAR